jgi:aspartyl-tRNA(Asn)/glutamyl-tRNA(Gln) amidotransferase subunit C
VAKRSELLLGSATFMANHKISLDAVRHVAKLAALELSEPEQVRMQTQLDVILSHMEELAEIDVSAVAPTFHSVSMPTALRPDVIVPSFERDELLRSAPAHEAGGFAVPKVMDGDG